MDFFAQKTHTESVECGNVAAVIAAQNRADSLFHFVCGLVRERHAKNVRRRNAHFLHEIQIAMRERFRLARSSSRHHAHIPLGGLHRLKLFLIQARTFHLKGIHNLSLHF